MPLKRRIREASSYYVQISAWMLQMEALQPMVQYSDKELNARMALFLNVRASAAAAAAGRAHTRTHARTHT